MGANWPRMQKMERRATARLDIREVTAKQVREGKGGKGREREGKGGKGKEREGKGGKGREERIETHSSADVCPTGCGGGVCASTILGLQPPACYCDAACRT
jgi:hypothetical protein